MDIHEQTGREISANERTDAGRVGTQSVTIQKQERPSLKTSLERRKRKSRKS